MSSPASLNDCILRNVYRYRYAVIIDFDEVIVPRLHKNYRLLVSDIQRKYHVINPHTITFANTYFFLEFGEDKTQPQVLKTLRHRRRINPLPIDVSKVQL
jgi:Glycosyltransferase family 92